MNKAVQNLLESASGNINKAVLCIRAVESLGEIRAMDTKDKKPTADTIKAMSDSLDIEAKLMAKAEKSLKGGKIATFDDLKGDVNSKGFIVLELQYNPTSLRLDTTAGQQYKYGGESGVTSVQKYDPPASTTLSFELLFDDFNNMDAFMLGDNPLTNASVSNIANTVTSMVKSKYSVQKQIDGLLSMLTIEQARHVIFFWGNMCFRGEVVEASATYTMFNKKGFPIRGKVAMQIRQGVGGDDIEQLKGKYKAEKDYWKAAFENTFTENGNSAGVFGKATNNSLLNLKL